MRKMGGLYLHTYGLSRVLSAVLGRGLYLEIHKGETQATLPHEDDALWQRITPVLGPASMAVTAPEGRASVISGSLFRRD